MNVNCLEDGAEPNFNQLPIALSLALGSAIVLWSGCIYEQSRSKQTFPGTIAVYSDLDKSIRILSCSGMGAAEPRGNIIAVVDDYPQAGMGLGRLAYLPEQTEIEWELQDSGQRYKQVVELPKNLRGASGTLLFYLSKQNEWSIWLTPDRDSLKSVPIHKPRTVSQ